MSAKVAENHTAVVNSSSQAAETPQEDFTDGMVVIIEEEKHLIEEEEIDDFQRPSSVSSGIFSERKAATLTKPINLEERPCDMEELLIISPNNEGPKSPGIIDDDSSSETELELVRNPDKEKIRERLTEIATEAQQILTSMLKAEFMSPEYVGLHQLL